MEKLIELIISFMKEIWETTYDISKYKYDDELKLIVIAENWKAFIDSIDIYRFLFGSDFIKWLVDKDKINRAFSKNVKYPYYLEKTQGNEWLLQCYEKPDAIKMILAISDNPIEDLISYLK